MSEEWVALGRITSPFGVKGWVKVHSFTEPSAQLFSYKPLYVLRQGQWQALSVTAHKLQGAVWIAKLAVCDDRDVAMLYRGALLGVTREQLAVLPEGDFYWSDLQNLEVWTETGILLGKVVRLLETGAHDVLVVQGSEEYLIPYRPGVVVKSVDLTSRRMVVDWNTDYLG